MVNKNTLCFLTILGYWSTSLVASPFEIPTSSILGSKQVRVFHDDNGFIVKDRFSDHIVKEYNINESLKGISLQQLKLLLGVDRPDFIELTQNEAQFIDFGNCIKIDSNKMSSFLSEVKNSSYIVINQTQDGEYLLELNHRILGGVLPFPWNADIHTIVAIYVTKKIINGVVKIIILAVKKD